MSLRSSFCKQSSSPRKRTGCTRSYSLPRKLEYSISSPIRRLRYLGGRLTAAAMAIVRPKAHQHSKKQVLTKTPSMVVIDSQRAEAIHDCIDFINSSSSFKRSNSFAAC